MTDPDEVSIFLNKAALVWCKWAVENDKNYHNGDFFWWFCNLDDEMQNDFVEYVNGL